MKKTYKYAVVGVLFLFLAGCEDFLDKREDSGEIGRASCRERV